jgi:hypothetical protein
MPLKSAGRIIGGTGLQQGDDLAAARAGALHDRVDALLGRKAHLDEVGHGNAVDGRIFHDRNHRVAMTAEHEGVDVADRDTLNSSARKVAEARAVEHARHADNLVVRQAGEFAQRPHHRVQRVGDADHECVRSVALDAFADRLHHLRG